MHEHEHHHHHHHGHDHGGEATPMEELVAMLRYMVGHNAAHTRDLAELAGQLNTVAGHAQYDQVMQAVREYEQANARLEAVLNELQ